MARADEEARLPWIQEHFYSCQSIPLAFIAYKFFIKLIVLYLHKIILNARRKFLTFF